MENELEKTGVRPLLYQVWLNYATESPKEVIFDINDSGQDCSSSTGVITGLHWATDIKMSYQHWNSHWNNVSLIARLLGPTLGPSGADRTQVGPMLPHKLSIWDISIWDFLWRLHNTFKSKQTPPGHRKTAHNNNINHTDMQKITKNIPTWIAYKKQMN